MYMCLLFIMFIIIIIFLFLFFNNLNYCKNSLAIDTTCIQRTIVGIMCKITNHYKDSDPPGHLSRIINRSVK